MSSKPGALQRHAHYYGIADFHDATARGCVHTGATARSASWSTSSCGARRLESRRTRAGAGGTAKPNDLDAERSRYSSVGVRGEGAPPALDRWADEVAEEGRTAGPRAAPSWTLSHLPRCARSPGARPTAIRSRNGGSTHDVASGLRWLRGDDTCSKVLRYQRFCDTAGCTEVGEVLRARVLRRRMSRRSPRPESEANSGEGAAIERGGCGPRSYAAEGQRRGACRRS